MDNSAPLVGAACCLSPSSSSRAIGYGDATVSGNSAANGGGINFAIYSALDGILGGSQARGL